LTPSPLSQKNPNRVALCIAKQRDMNKSFPSGKKFHCGGDQLVTNRGGDGEQ
jgi:hypothetical protein